MTFLLEHTFCTSISPLSLLMQLQKSINGSEDWKWSSLGGAEEGWEDASEKTDNWYWCLRLNDNATCSSWCLKRRPVGGVTLSWNLNYQKFWKLATFFFSSSLFYNSFDIHEFVWGIYKQSAYFSILYQVSKGLFNKSLTTQRAITEIEIMKRRKGCSLEYIILQ